MQLLTEGRPRVIEDFATLDFETYFDKDYSLKKLQTDAYVLDPRFEIVGVSYKANKASPVEWFSSPRLGDYAEHLREVIDWPHVAVCAHHTHFDGFIATQRLGLKPSMWMDTMSMARVLYPWLGKYSLYHLATVFGVGRKGDVVHDMLGRHLADLSPAELEEYAEYGCNDTVITDALARLFLKGGYPALEHVLTDLTIRMFTEPTLHGDAAIFMECHADEVSRKALLLEKAGVDKAVIMSNPKFAEALEGLGVAAPTKVSPRTGKRTLALAKTDQGMQDLKKHPNEKVRNLIEARLGVKTSIAETRALNLAAAAIRGPLPVYLNHWGARTTGRLSGGNKMNYQNLPARGSAAKLRTGLVAPKGSKVVVGDSSNIELRLGMVLAGENDVVDKIRAGVDMYCEFASEIYARPITKEDKAERFLGKVAMLSLQYGTGAETFAGMATTMTGEKLDVGEALRIVHMYRRRYRHLVKLWQYCDDVILPAISEGKVLIPVDVPGMFLTTPTGFGLPGQAGVQYKDLARGSGGRYDYTQGPLRVNTYGPKVYENLCQHAARQVVMWQTARFSTQYKVALSVHDEIVAVVPDDKVEVCSAYMLECLSTAPPWCRGRVPLTGEVAQAQSYGDAK